MGNFSAPDEGHGFSGNPPTGNLSYVHRGFSSGGHPPMRNYSVEDNGPVMIAGQFGGYSHPPRNNEPVLSSPLFEKPIETTIDCLNAG